MDQRTIDLLVKLSRRNDDRTYVVEEGTAHRPPRAVSFFESPWLAKRSQGASPNFPRPGQSARRRPRQSRRSARARVRSPGSSRDEPSEPDPPVGGVRLSERPCKVCGELFIPKRKSTARTCSTACKQRAYRQRLAKARVAALSLTVEPAVYLDAADGCPLLALDLAMREREIRLLAEGRA